MKYTQVAGLTNSVKVIENGSDAPGTILKSCSESFRRRFDKVDLVIAKGQGNFKILNDIDKNVSFMLMPKCMVLARHLDCEIGSLVLKNSDTGG